MRIRKLPIAVLSSSSWKNAGAFPCRDEEERFLRPLVEAAMEVQAKAEAEIAGHSTPQPMVDREICEIGGAIRRRPPHNWRNALLHCNAEVEEVQVSSECNKSNLSSKGVIRRNREDKGGSSTLREKNLCERTVNKKRSKQYGTAVGHLNAARENKEKANGGKKENYYHEGSQCRRRRNGRGWRCSQQTLVGYSLCEHHLGKARFRSINPSNCSGTAMVRNSKDSKFKELHLIEPVLYKVKKLE